MLIVVACHIVLGLHKCCMCFAEGVLHIGNIFLSPLGHAYSLDICTVIDAYTAA